MRFFESKQLVEQILERFAEFDDGSFACRNRDRLFGEGIEALSFRFFFYFVRSEVCDCNFVACFESFCDNCCVCVNRCGCVFVERSAFAATALINSALFIFSPPWDCTDIIDEKIGQCNTFFNICVLRAVFYATGTQSNL